MKIVALLPTVLALAASPLAGQTPLPEMQLELESRDGNAADVSGPDVVTSAAATGSRVWGAGGRRRPAYQVSNRERRFFEEDDDFATKLVALEVDVDNASSIQDRLFSLTARQVAQSEIGTTTIPATIKVDRIEFQNAPFTLQTLHFPASDAPLGIRVVPDANLLLVLTAQEFRVYSYDNPARTLPTDPLDPTVLGSPLGVATLPTGTTTHGHTFGAMRGAVVASIQTPTGDQRVALVTATISGSGCAPLGKPQPWGLLVCNIEGSPFFYDTDLSKQAWEPDRPSGAPCEEWAGHGVAHVRTTGLDPRDLVYFVGGEKIGLTELDVTDVSNPSIGIEEKLSFESTEPLFRVVADPEAPAVGRDYLYVFGRHNAYVVDRAKFGMPPGWVTSASAEFSINGPAGDAHLVLTDTTLGPGRREAWTLGQQSARHLRRVTDFTQDGLGLLDDPVSDGYYAAGPTDGAVANFFWKDAFLPTFGGVVRWDISGTEPVPVETSYQPAHDTVTQHDYTTEHLELVDLGPAGNPAWHLIAPCALGNFFAWPLDSTTHDPLPGAIYEPAGYWPGGWSGVTYGNDIAMMTHPTTGEKYVYVDFSNHPTGNIGIGRYNWSTGSWVAPPLIWTDPALPHDITPNVRDLSVEGTWMLAAANGGFLVIDLLTWQVTDHVYTNDVDGLSFGKVMGIERHGDRIFVSLADPTNRFAFAMYHFDAASGHVIDPGTGLQGDVPLQVLFDGSAGKPDDFPGVFLDGGERMSLIQTQADPKQLRLYSGSGNGSLVEIEWDETTDTMTPLSRWHNGGYFAHVGDCNVYKLLSAKPGGSSLLDPEPSFTLRILVAKAQETFEIVSPPDMP